MRKKFTMLFAALLAFAGVAKAQHWLQPTVSTETETYEYYIQNYRNAAYFVTTTSGLAGGAQQLGSANAFDETKAKVTFKLVEGGKLWSTNTATPLILGYTTTGEAANSVQLFAADSQEGYTWKIESANGGNTLSAGTSNNSWNMHGGAGANIGLYRKSDGGSNWVFVPANDAAAAKAAEAKAMNVPSPEYYYQIKNVAYSRMLAANATNATSISTNSTADLNQLWAFEQGENGTFYLRNAGQEKYLVASTQDGTAWTVGEEGTAFDVEIQNFKDKSWTIHAVGQDGYGCAHDANWGWDAQVVRWEAAASASQWYLEKTDISAKAEEISFTYSLKYNGIDKGTQECTTLIGAAYPDVTGLPYGIKAAIPAGELTEEVAGTTITVELSDDLPFVAAADANNISTWYYVQMHSNNKKFIQYIDDKTAIEWADAQVDASAKDSYTWAFVGNSFDGFKFVNKAATTAKALKSENDGNPKMAAYADATSFVLAATSETSQGAAGGFCLKYPGGKCLNAQSGAIAHWGSTDAGSTFTVVLRDDAAQIRELVKKAKKDLNALGEGETVGYVTAACKTTINNAIAAAEAAINSWEGIETAETNLQAALANLETIQPEADKFYILHNNFTDKYANVSDEAGMRTAATASISEVFQFIPAEGGNFYLKNVERGTYLSIHPTHNNQHGYNPVLASATTFENAHAVTIANLGAQNIVSITPVGGATLHHDTNQNNVFSYTGGLGTKSEWVIEEVNIADYANTLTVSDAGWATLVLGYNTTIPANVKAYAVSSIAEGKAVLTEVTEVLPAHTPVLIEAAKGEYAFNYTATEATVASNLLAGSVFNTYVAPVEGTTNYVLSNNNSVVALYKKTTTNADGKIEFGANKAYLPVVTAAEGAPAMFAFGRDAEEGTTGIDQFISNEEVVIYDLAGRRVQKMEKGIYIVNGKKVVIK